MFAFEKVIIGVVLLAFIVWLLLMFVFRPIGKLVKRATKKLHDNINEKDDE